MRKKVLVVVRQLVCHQAVGALGRVVSGEGEAEMDSRQWGQR